MSNAKAPSLSVLKAAGAWQVTAFPSPNHSVKGFRPLDCPGTGHVTPCKTGNMFCNLARCRKKDEGVRCVRSLCKGIGQAWNRRRSYHPAALTRHSKAQQSSRAASPSCRVPLHQPCPALVGCIAGASCERPCTEKTETKLSAT